MAAAPGQFFPQQFAGIILQLAQSNKQFQARLHDQRQQAAARNFMEKQQLDLAERAQALAEFKAGQGRQQAAGEGGRGGQAGFDRPQAGFGAVGQFRQKSAESAMGVRDQLQLTKGTADISRAAKLQDATDGTLIKKALGDFADLGIATISKENVGVIPSLREALRIRAGGAPKPADSKEGDIGVNIGVDDSGKLVPVGRSAEPDTSPTRQDISEMRLPNGDVVITRVGGTSPDEQKAVAQLEQIRATTKKTVADIALSRERADSTKLLGQKRGLEIERLKKGVGRADNLRVVQGMFGIMKTTESVKGTLMDILQRRKDDLQRKLPSALTLADEAIIREQMDVAQKEMDVMGMQDSVEVVVGRNKAAGKLLKNFNESIAAVLGAQGDEDSPPGGDPDVRRDLVKENHNILHLIRSEGLEVARTMLGELGDQIYKVLPTSVSLPLQNNKTGKTEKADFHQARLGLIPLNRPAWVLAGMIRSSKQKSSLNIHPEFETFGWKPTARAKPTDISPDSVAPVDESEFEAEDETRRDTKFQSLTQQLNELAPGSPEAAALSSELRKLLESE